MAKKPQNLEDHEFWSTTPQQIITPEDLACIDTHVIPFVELLVKLRAKQQGSVSPDESGEQ